MSEWQNVALKQLVKFGNGKSRPKEKGKIPVYGGNGILDFTDKHNYVGNTLIIGRVGAYCGATYLEKSPVWVSDNALSAKALGNNDSDYLYYLFKYLDLNHYAQGSSHPLLTQTLLNAIEVETTLDGIEQKAIASVLSSLDDKINLLHRQNKTLESIAETLFRQWFVEEAQDDWEEKTLADFGKVVCGKTPSKKKSEYYGNDIPFLKIPDMHGRVFISSTEDNLSLLGAESQLNKLLPEGSLCVSCIATVGLVCITSKPMQTNQQINSIIPKSSKYLYFLFLLMKSINDELHSLASGGTTTLNLNTGNFSKIKICVPPKEDIFSFNQSVYDFFEKIKSNTNQIQTLEKLRDTLLPKLMSGEVRVNYTPEEIKQ
ncbi:restriction endonuclease subunit S [Proteus vulgaris]|uniref:restriction endonuclease subunit S n=1 Tax=Proteus vulgaris TaxID=585 RepID=UPI0018C60221|nr:restriction endonuclease subunit S [Proteus vulgaris]MBG5986796.1 restriction endonuclease subunit S [Proteus vulgaris]